MERLALHKKVLLLPDPDQRPVLGHWQRRKRSIQVLTPLAINVYPTGLVEGSQRI